MSRVLHHYTSLAGLAGILESQTIRASLRANNPKDARFGDGQYLSDIPPHTKRPGQLSLLFLGMPWAGKRFTEFVTIDTSGLAIIFGRPGVYVVKNKGPLDISTRLVEHGKN